MSGDAISGMAGEAVTAELTFTNDGPAWFGQPRLRRPGGQGPADRARGHQDHRCAVRLRQPERARSARYCGCPRWCPRWCRRGHGPAGRGEGSEGLPVLSPTSVRRGDGSTDGLPGRGGAQSWHLPQRRPGRRLSASARSAPRTGVDGCPPRDRCGGSTTWQSPAPRHPAHLSQGRGTAMSRWEDGRRRAAAAHRLSDAPCERGTWARRVCVPSAPPGSGISCRRPTRRSPRWRFPSGRARRGCTSPTAAACAA